MRRFLRDNGLALFFSLIFAAALLGEAVAGYFDYNNGQLTAGLTRVGWADYLTSANFAADVTENWQSEYLQYLLYILATVWFVQRGSPESKQLDDAGRGSDEDQQVGPHATPESPPWARAGGWRTAVFSRSLGLTMGGIFGLSWLGQSIAGWSANNGQRLADLESPLSWPGYITSADFWNRTLQNWQSEFLALGSMAILAVYLRERGSSESKPVGAPHDDTGS